MKEKKWTFAIVDNADAITEFLNERELAPSDVHIVLANYDKFYVFYLG